MKLADLDEVKRLASTRAKLAAELDEIRQAETALVEITSKAPGTGVLKVSLVGGVSTMAGTMTAADDVLFQAVIDVLVMGFEKRLATIDARLAEIGVTP